jgi:hypothetical protein
MFNLNPAIRSVIASEVARRSRSKPKARFLTTFGTSSAILSFPVRLPRTLWVLAMTDIAIATIVIAGFGFKIVHGMPVPAVLFFLLTGYLFKI